MIDTRDWLGRRTLSTRRDLRETVFFGGPDASAKVSRYWLLLVLAAIIAAAGVVGDSEATVIGAMIVAPLRTPIMGTILAVVLGERRQLFRSLFYLVTGATAAVGVGYLMGLVVLNTTDLTSNDQVTTWSQARLIDLIAALAVGAVGSIAIIRRDISDTVPGVAIAISLVPPLTVMGLTLQSGAHDQAWGAFLLFATNVAAIWGVGIITMAIYRVQRLPELGEQRDTGPVNRGEAYVMIGILLVVIVGLLAEGSVSTTRDVQRESRLADVVSTWGDDYGWELVDVTTDETGIVARLEGPLPMPDEDGLEQSLIDADLDPTSIEIDLVPRDTITFGEDLGDG